MTVAAAAFAFAFAVMIVPAAPASADEEPSRPLMFTVDSGICIPADHLHYSGEVGLPPPLDIGVTLQVHLRGPFEANVSAGAALLLGAKVGATARYATPSAGAVRATFGLGPLLVTDADFGSALFGQADIALEVRSKIGFAVVIGPKLAIALNRAGSATCGVDTCSAYVTPGDTVFTLRVGIGFTL